MLDVFGFFPHKKLMQGRRNHLSHTDNEPPWPKDQVNYWQPTTTSHFDKVALISPA